MAKIGIAMKATGVKCKPHKAVFSLKKTNEKEKTYKLQLNKKWLTFSVMCTQFEFPHTLTFFSALTKIIKC